MNDDQYAKQSSGLTCVGGVFDETEGVAPCVHSRCPKCRKYFGEPNRELRQQEAEHFANARPLNRSAVDVGVSAP
jgi:hypothetical protein